MLLIHGIYTFTIVTDYVTISWHTYIFIIYLFVIVYFHAAISFIIVSLDAAILAYKHSSSDIFHAATLWHIDIHHCKFHDVNPWHMIYDI